PSLLPPALGERRDGARRAEPGPEKEGNGSRRVGRGRGTTCLTARCRAAIDQTIVSVPSMNPLLAAIAVPQPVPPAPQGSKQRQKYVPGAPVWIVNTVRACAATGTLIPSAGIVKVCETAAGSRLVSTRSGPLELFGLRTSIGVTAIVAPTVPETVA